MIAKTAMAVAAVATLTIAAQAADLVVDSPAVEAPAVSAWDGFYVGVFGGYAQGTITTTDNDLLISPFDEPYEGYLLGVAGGYNFTLSDNVVGGFQADIAYNNAATEYDSYDIAVDYSGSLTARVGLDLGGFVPYALGGISFANVSVTDRNVVPGPLTDEAFHAGYVLGVGGEFGITDNLSANVEYRYTNYGTQIYEDLADVTSAELADSSVRGGVNFHF